jgi:hypothetical protein
MPMVHRISIAGRMASGRIRGLISTYRGIDHFRTQDTGLFLHSFAPVLTGAAPAIFADSMASVPLEHFPHINKLIQPSQ